MMVTANIGFARAGTVVEVWGETRDVLLHLSSPRAPSSIMFRRDSLGRFRFTRASRRVILLSREARERGSPWTVPVPGLGPKEQGLAARDFYTETKTILISP